MTTRDTGQHSHGILNRAHGILNRAHGLLNRAHDLVIRAHGLVIRAHGLARLNNYFLHVTSGAPYVPGRYSMEPRRCHAENN